MTRRRADADLELCQHEIERLRAREHTLLATVRRFRRQLKCRDERIAELERQLACRRS